MFCNYYYEQFLRTRGSSAYKHRYGQLQHIPHLLQGNNYTPEHFWVENTIYGAIHLVYTQNSCQNWRPSPHVHVYFPLTRGHLMHHHPVAQLKADVDKLL